MGLAPQVLATINTVPHRYYRHYKGGYYKILCLSLHTEEVDLMNQPRVMVNYVDVYGTRWTRPFDMFFGQVEPEDLAEAAELAMKQGVTLNEVFIPVTRFTKVSAKEFYYHKFFKKKKVA